MLLNANISSPPLPLGNDALEIAGRRKTGRIVKASVCGGVAWIAYLFASGTLSSRYTFQDPRVATISFLALALTVAAYVAMRQQRDLVEQTQANPHGSGRGNGKSRPGGRHRRSIRCRSLSPIAKAPSNTSTPLTPG